MKLVVLLLSLFCISSLTAQQNFQKSYGTTGVERVISLVETDEKEIVILGSTSGDVINLTKIDSSGNLISSILLPIQGEYSGKMRSTTDGGFILCGSGQITSTVGHEYILKLDANAEQEWCVTTLNFYNHIRDVMQTLDGGYVAVADSLIMKFNAQGDLIWNKSHISNTVDNLFFKSIQQVTADSSFIVAGEMINDPNTFSTISISKISKTGESVWHKLYPAIHDFRNIQILENNHLVLFCRNSITELDENGAIISRITLSEFYSSNISNGEKKDDHYLLFGGHSGQGAIGGGDFLLVKLDLGGNLIWAKLLGGTLGEGLVSQINSLDGGSIMLGVTRSFSVGREDYFLIKTDSLNTYNCNTLPYTLATTFSMNGTTTDFTTTVNTDPFFLINDPVIPNNSLISLEEHDACGCIEPIAQFEFYPNSGDIVNNSIWPGQSTFYIYDMNNILVNEFTDEGTYNLCLSVENLCGSDSVCELVYYDPMPISTDELDSEDKEVAIIPLNDHQLLIRFESEQYNTRIRLIDLTGKEVFDEEFTGNECVFDVGRIQQAMYFIQIEDQGDALHYSRKIVIGYP